MMQQDTDGFFIYQALFDLAKAWDVCIFCPALTWGDYVALFHKEHESGTGRDEAFEKISGKIRSTLAASLGVISETEAFVPLEGLVSGYEGPRNGKGFGEKMAFERLVLYKMRDELATKHKHLNIETSRTLPARNAWGVELQTNGLSSPNVKLQDEVDDVKKRASGLKSKTIAKKFTEAKLGRLIAAQKGGHLHFEHERNQAGELVIYTFINSATATLTVFGTKDVSDEDMAKTSTKILKLAKTV